MKISKGKKNKAVKGVIYGSEGIGKSTLASQFPDPLFLDLESGTNQLDVKRVSEVTLHNNKTNKDQESKLNNWYALKQAIRDVYNEPEVCKTLVIDTADAAEIFCNDYITHKHNIESIAQLDYGKGYQYLADEFQKLLDDLTVLNRDKGINIVFISHSHLKKFEQPEEFGAYDKYELKLDKRIAAKVKEWGDFVLFLNYKTEVVKADGKMGSTYKGTGGKRVIYTTHSPVWDAKNRFGLDEELPLSYDSIKQIFQTGIDQEMRVNSDDDPVLDQGKTLKADNTVVEDEPYMIMPDEDIEDPKLKEIVGDPTVAKVISRLSQAGLKESDATKFLISRDVKKIKGDGKKLEDYDKNWITKNIINKWDVFKSKLEESKGD